MCGIVAVIGSREAAPLLLEGLRQLEYSGYDSAGIATVNGERQLNWWDYTPRAWCSVSWSLGPQIAEMRVDSASRSHQQKKPEPVTGPFIA